MKKSGSKKTPTHAKSKFPAAKKMKSGQKSSVKTMASRKGAAAHSRAGSSAKKGAAHKAGRGKAASDPPVILKREPTAEEIKHQKQVMQFESAVKLFNHGDFAKARDVFDHLAAAAAQELAQRSRVYLNICSQRLSRPALRLKTADDFYNYAVSMANQGNQQEAEENLGKALKLSPKSDYIYYALATTYALRENVEAALEHLQKAIQLNERNRYLAQNDPDFAALGEDPRFTELIYPEKPVA
jgi:tetratricopeptide (TPR) repeat protein